MKGVFALRARNDRVPRRLLRIRLFALLDAGKIVLRVINDQQNSGKLLAAVVLDFLGVAQVDLAGGAALRLREFLPQPRGHDVT